MQESNVKITDLQEKLIKLRSDLDNLSQSFYKNNFSSSQTFTKGCVFTSSLKVPSYSSAPSVGQIGEIIEVAGILYICTVDGDVASPATFTKVGAQ